MRAAAILLATSLGLTACATELTPTAVDTRSPVAARVAREAGAPARMPTFADIPARPTDVRTVAGYDAAVGANRAEGAALQRWFVDNPRMSGDTEAFVAEARTAIAPAGPPLTPEQAAESARFAAAARASAAPPPPPR